MAVTLTEAAARHVSRFLAKRGKGVGVRLGVKTTGCSGLAYKLEYADAAVLAPGALALDMMYGPAAAPFLAWAAHHGATGRDGLGMLVEQAAQAFALWRGVLPETAPVLDALRQRWDETA